MEEGPSSIQLFFELMKKKRHIFDRLLKKMILPVCELKHLYNFIPPHEITFLDSIAMEQVYR